MERRAYRLIPRSGLHLGREGLAQESDSDVFPSDSLFAALVALQAAREISQLGALLAGLPIGDSAGQTSLRLSSCFPLVGDVIFFPMPRLRIEGATASKSLKKIRYVSWAILQRLLKGQSMADYMESTNKVPGKARFIQKQAFWLMAEEQAQLPDMWHKDMPEKLNQQTVVASEPTTRVSVDRVQNYSTVYQVARTTFAPDCGLWLLVEAEEDRQRIIYNLLLDLQETGIGAERSSGYGSFALFNLPLAPEMQSASDGTGRGLLLSRYNPQSAELAAGVLGERASYDLVDVGGWLYAPGQASQRRQRIRMLEAGSLLDLSSLTRVEGRVVDVRPTYPTAQFPHPIYRSGLALTL